MARGCSGWGLGLPVRASPRGLPGPPRPRDGAPRGGIRAVTRPASESRAHCSPSRAAPPPPPASPPFLPEGYLDSKLLPRQAATSSQALDTAPGSAGEPKRPRSSPSCWSCLRVHSVCSGRAGPRMGPGPPCATGGWRRGRGRVTFPPGLQVEQTRAGEPEDSGREQNSRCRGRGAAGLLLWEGGLAGPCTRYQNGFPVCPPVSK